MTTGTLYGLGVGPGDPDLLTVKALRIIRDVPVIAYPAPDEGASLARSIVAPHLERDYEEIVIRMPLDAARFPAEDIYDDAATMISARLQAGQDVAVLCEGDAFMYGSFLYLYQRLAADHQVIVVPGVSSPMACAAALGAPLAARNDALMILPTTLPEDELSKRMALADGVVLIKVGRHIDKARRALASVGLADTAQYIERASMANERILPLADAPSPAPYFSIIIAHRRQDAWR
ncbi:MAG: precorrin-2 C(20)-methyltransferase [Alphaproteobacteria bacterium]|jgi:precorrin-2/cobalt-factor-2 C20-methyltransferase|nr:precorrin-2 C(20)-methyltransferase [Alphaproteobacteria bacterium]